MVAYEVAYVDTNALTSERLQTPAGKRVVDLLSAYQESLRLCFPESFVEGGRFSEVREQVDAARGVSAAARRKADLSAAVAADLASTEEIFLVLDARGRFVAGCTTRDRRDRSKANEIDGVCVAEKHRGRGVCGLMIASAAKLYSDRKDAVKIACVTENTGACRCYAKLFERARKASHKSLGKLTLFSGVRGAALPATGPRKL